MWKERNRGRKRAYESFASIVIYQMAFVCLCSPAMSPHGDAHYHSPVTTPGKGLLTATAEKDEAPPKGVMTVEDEQPPKGVRTEAWLL